MSEGEKTVLSTPPAIKPPVDLVVLAHKEFRDDEYWRAKFRGLYRRDCVHLPSRGLPDNK